jgi:ABC-type sulfate transport system permease component
MPVQPDESRSVLKNLSPPGYSHGGDVKRKISASGPKQGPLLFFIIVVLIVLGGPVTAATALYANGARSGLNDFLVDLYANHRLLYAIVVTAGTAILGIVLSFVMGWLLRILRIDRMR